MKAILHWVQDFYIISVDLTIAEMNEVMFIGQLGTAMYMEDIINKLIKKYNTKAKEASTG